MYINNLTIVVGKQTLFDRGAKVAAWPMKTNVV